MSVIANTGYRKYIVTTRTGESEFIYTQNAVEVENCLRSVNGCYVFEIRGIGNKHIVMPFAHFGTLIHDGVARIDSEAKGVLAGIVLGAMASQNKINGIKSVRAQTNWGLKEAKEFYEGVESLWHNIESRISHVDLSQVAPFSDGLYMQLLYRIMMGLKHQATDYFQRHTDRSLFEAAEVVDGIVAKLEKSGINVPEAQEK